MNKRYLFKPMKDLAFARKKMAFLSGPRQVGKTTLAKMYRADFQHFQYNNWDEMNFRRLWSRSPQLAVQSFRPEKEDEAWLFVFDEIHKSKGWKSKLKGLYDEVGQGLSILVTGSARINVYKRGSDSLMGRYLNFRLHPFSYGELCGSEILDPETWKKKILQGAKQRESPEILEKLLRYSGFPEPYSTASDKIMNIWRKDRHDKIIREDLRDLSRIPELSQVEMLAALLPEKVGSPLSVQSLREDLEVAFDTVKNWLRSLEELYFFFAIKPWSKSVPRSLKKEGKIYLYDWTEVEDEGARFENLVAAQLLKACHYWVDTGEGDFDLHYLRNKEKQEVDFLITKKNKPWLMIEAKRSESSIDRRTAEKFVHYLKCPYLQVTLEDKIFHFTDNVGVISASRLFHGLP